MKERLQAAIRLETTGKDEFFFDPDEHRYFLGRLELPSVTRVLSAAWPFDIPERFTRPARERGTEVHLVCQFYDEDDLVDSSVRDEIRPYFEAWKSFREQEGFVPDEIEVRRYNPDLKYAGTIDRVGRLRSGRRIIIDIKTGRKYKTHPIQLAAYAHLLEDPITCGRAIVTLKDDGCYDFEEYPSSQFGHDFMVFRSALNIYKFNLENP